QIRRFGKSDCVTAHVRPLLVRLRSMLFRAFSGECRADRIPNDIGGRIDDVAHDLLYARREFERNLLRHRCNLRGRRGWLLPATRENANSEKKKNRWVSAHNLHPPKIRTNRSTLETRRSSDRRESLRTRGTTTVRR